MVPKVFDEEAEQYAVQIFELLTEAGFDVRHASKSTETVFVWNTWRVLFVRNMSKPPLHAAPLQACFKSANIILRGYVGLPDRADADVLMLAVGTKP